ncbi:MAG TPA: hypothetical protein VM688_05925 [Nocardioidaceae bacterium]|nr:hypothetical protein [Nocardioidaceae bacterium]
MRWEERLLDLFDDLEQQAEGLALIGRDAEVAELSRAEYAQVDLADRLHASEGRSVRFGVNGFGLIEARLARVGEGWCLLADGPTEWLVRTPAIRSARGLSQHGRTAMARPLTARLGLTSALRGVAETRSAVVVHHLDATSQRGLLGRVGADFVELAVGDDAVATPTVGDVEVVPFWSLAAVRTSAR